VNAKRHIPYLWTWLKGQLRLRRLRRQRDFYAQAVDLPFDRQASLKLDAAQFLLESEEADEA
jgi:hypothetical protein